MKYILFISFLTIQLLFYGCNDSFDPNGESKDIYALTCIIKNDSENQTATLSHIYRVDGFDPYTNTVDPSIIGADLRVWVGDSVYVFRDTSIVRTDTSRYKTPFYYYYNNNFGVVPNKTIEVEVLLQNGRRLRASSKSPKEIYFDKIGYTKIPSSDTERVSFKWNEQADPIFFTPQLTIRYLQNINGTDVEKYKKVPIQYIERDNEQIAVFPVPSIRNSVIYQMDAINRAMQEISSDDPDKSHFTIFQKQEFSVVAFDLNLTRYISSTDQSFDDLTVTVNESDYSNVSGGLGIFGCYIKKVYDRVELYRDYVESFGYNFFLGE